MVVFLPSICYQLGKSLCVPQVKNLNTESNSCAWKMLNIQLITQQLNRNSAECSRSIFNLIFISEYQILSGFRKLNVYPGLFYFLTYWIITTFGQKYNCFPQFNSKDVKIKFPLYLRTRQQCLHNLYIYSAHCDISHVTLSYQLFFSDWKDEKWKAAKTSYSIAVVLTNLCV